MVGKSLSAKCFSLIVFSILVDHSNCFLGMSRPLAITQSSTLTSIIKLTIFKASTTSEWETETRLPKSMQTITQSDLPLPPLRNLRSAGSTALREDPLLQSWNELKGLSERDLLSDEDTSSVKKREKALGLAYRRCEYVTQLFSKTFYMGTSLMEPAARQHVWAIYAWCRRTGTVLYCYININCRRRNCYFKLYTIKLTVNTHVLYCIAH